MSKPPGKPGFTIYSFVETTKQDTYTRRVFFSGRAAGLGFGIRATIRGRGVGGSPNRVIQSSPSPNSIFKGAGMFWVLAFSRPGRWKAIDVPLEKQMALANGAYTPSKPVPSILNQANPKRTPIVGGASSFQVGTPKKMVNLLKV